MLEEVAEGRFLPSVRPCRGGRGVKSDVLDPIIAQHYTMPVEDSALWSMIGSSMPVEDSALWSVRPAFPVFGVVKAPRYYHT